MQEPNAESAEESTSDSAKPIYRLKLDHDGVYWGAEEIETAAVGDIVLDHAPDNSPGRYKWNAEQQCFDALPASQIKSAPEAPTLEQAFHHLAQSLKEAGHALPAAVCAWCEEFKQSIDSKG